MEREELTKTYDVFELKKTFGLHGFYKHISALKVKGDGHSVSPRVPVGRPACIHLCTRMAGRVRWWLKLPAWKAGDRGLEPHSGL